MYFGQAGLANRNAEFQQLSVNVGSAPEGIFAAHSVEQLANLTGDCRSPGFPAANLPGPEKAKAFAMPSDDRVRLDDGQG